MKNIKIQEVTIDKLSYTAVPLKILTKQGMELAICTGFIYKNLDKYYLITNWHCVTGKNSETKEPIGKNGFVLPGEIEIPFLKTKNPISWIRYKYKLIDSELNPLWLIHPNYKEKVDVIALPITIPEGIIINNINEVPFDNYKALIADDIFILGFPYNINGTGNFPIWKRGSIATEPDIDYEQKPQILVDTASRTGMSGAPVIFRRSGIHGIKNGELNDNSIFGEIENFVGIYSGRYKGDSEFDAQLGIVWKERVIKEIINGGLVNQVSDI